ncbi:MAG: hypothetical protein ABF979_15910 [Gluconobacter sp.]|uniref:hypothetical protein n=1 Tax=Gluconobacter sp. TaxID=1876758 RepID=UPI0039ECA704
MTQKKLEIIGPYTPEHEGPFCTRDGRPVRLITKEDGSKEYPVVGYIEEAAHPALWRSNGDTYHKRLRHSENNINDLMNAREVPVAREFWVNEYRNSGWGGVFETEEKAAEWKGSFNFIRTIRVREVLPGEGA